jgi:hypothetical protein
MTETEYPATALQDILFGLKTSLEGIIRENEGADIPGSTFEEWLLFVASRHPEPGVANYLTYEVKRLFQYGKDSNDGRNLQ